MASGQDHSKYSFRTNKVRKLIDEMKFIAEWPFVEMNAVLLIYDVCNAVGMTDEEINWCLGAKGAKYLQILLDGNTGWQVDKGSNNGQNTSD